MSDQDSPSDHIGTMCQFFRELHIAGCPLGVETKVVKTVCKRSQRWYEWAEHSQLIIELSKLINRGKRENRDSIFPLLKREKSE